MFVDQWLTRLPNLKIQDCNVYRWSQMHQINSSSSLIGAFELLMMF